MASISNSISMAHSLDLPITQEEEAERLALIQYALKEDKLIPYYQGLYNNQTNTIDKYEALMRICGPDGSVYRPKYFMPVSKKYGLYLDLNLVMFEKVFRDFSKIDCTVSLNLSPYHLMSQSFCETVFSYLAAFHKPSNIIFEILEDECTIDIGTLAPFIHKARSYGAKIAIDDFGAGYSNLLSILKLRPDFLKIDGQIIMDLDTSLENEVIVEAVSDIGQKLSIDLVAEFVESEAIQKVVENHGILYSQGYHFSKPQPFSAVCQVEQRG